MIPCSRLWIQRVDKAYQGQQLGARLMKHALLLTHTVARQIGSFGLYQDADPLPLALYQRLGLALLHGDASPATSPMFLPLGAIG
jgi:GNAT superfamily N-acetyltransferase